MVGGQVIAYLGGIHYWWPKMTGKMYSEFWGKISAMLIFIGFNLTFFPQFILGYQGMPRRYASYPRGISGPEYFLDGRCVRAWRSAILMPMIYLLHSLFYGKPAGRQSVAAAGSRMADVSSPPPTENFDVMPVVTWEAYEFGEESGLDLEGARGTETVKV